MTVAQLHAEFEKLRDLRIDYNTKQAMANDAEAAMKAQQTKVRELAEQEGISGRVRTRTGHIFDVPEPTEYAVIQDFSAFQKWAQQNQPGLLTPNTRVTKAMNSLVRERLDDGRPMPPGLGHSPRPTVKVFGVKSIKKHGEEE